MILKDLSTMPNGVDCWSFYDNVEKADYYFDKKLGKAVVAVTFQGCDSAVVIPILKVAYLCNDKGQTIERLNPFNSLEETK